MEEKRYCNICEMFVDFDGEHLACGHEDHQCTSYDDDDYFWTDGPDDFNELNFE